MVQNNQMKFMFGPNLDILLCYCVNIVIVVEFIYMRMRIQCNVYTQIRSLMNAYKIIISAIRTNCYTQQVCTNLTNLD